MSTERITQGINFHGSITGQVNIAGQTISSPIFSLILADIEKKISDSDAPPEEKEEAHTRLKAFLAHPIVAGIVGALAGNIPM